ncbi:GreA/GreB family elongation factor [Paraflavisolibacter sp. H34]|uniref:GreA/GreB family elongation factor n=1 Tax=Huijunlia imazamoxiresistens TaxID=3127457 RepID=UPI003017D224
MPEVNEQPIFSQEDYERAKLEARDHWPPEVVRLNSRVTIQDAKEGKVLELTVVLPEKADIKQRKVSVRSPAGTALIGCRTGDTVAWEVPSGRKAFTILEVAPSGN